MAISNVVCAVDIDDQGEAVFRQALAVTRAHDARLLLVCPVPPGHVLSRAAERAGSLLRARRAGEAEGVDVHVSVQTGDPAEIVVRYADAECADLIVVGVDHGCADGHARGAVAEDVLRSASSPTLVVAPGVSPQSRFRAIVCAANLARDGGLSLESALTLADPGDHTVTMLHVVPNGTESGTSLLQAMLAAPERAAEAQTVVGQPAAEILKTVSNVNADLLVVGARPRNRVARRLFGVARRLLTSSPCHVLAVPVKKAATGNPDEHAALARWTRASSWTSKPASGLTGPW